jgi:aminopeptidase N
MKNSLPLLFLFFATFLYAQRPIYDSGGPLIPEQARMDVHFYDLSLAVDIDKQWIEGSLAVTYTALEDHDKIILDLDTTFEVSQINWMKDGRETTTLWERQSGELHIYMGENLEKGREVTVNVYYAGHPLSVDNPKKYSWADGFFWAETPAGEPWVGNVSVLNGADIWWPCKDHPSDETDSMAMNITVDKGLTVAMNGRLRGITEHDDGTNTHHWFISTPVNNYAVTLNIAPYKTVQTTFKSVSGDTFPFIFYTIPEHYEQAKDHLKYFERDMAFLEKLLGPYPFRADKYGVAETYYLGMETQSIIAYGNDFRLNEYGFDFLHFHELAHEWFANLVTCRDWKDWWIHEGFGSYTESLYAEDLKGEETYHEYARGYLERAQNKKPVVLSKTGHVSAREGYHSDVYGKGAAILHSLRYLLGKEKMYEALRRMAYPDPAMEKVTDGSQCRLSDTDEFQQIAEKLHGQSLEWFFHNYLMYSQIPALKSSVNDRVLKLEWQIQSNVPFEMPVQVKVGGKLKTVKMKGGKGKIKVKEENYEMDPRGWILCKKEKA